MTELITLECDPSNYPQCSNQLAKALEKGLWVQLLPTKRVNDVIHNKSNELVWILEHPSTFTAGKTYEKDEILDKNINISGSMAIKIVF